MILAGKTTSPLSCFWEQLQYQLSPGSGMMLVAPWRMNIVRVHSPVGNTIITGLLHKASGKAEGVFPRGSIDTPSRSIVPIYLSINFGNQPVIPGADLSDQVSIGLLLPILEL